MSDIQRGEQSVEQSRRQEGGIQLYARPWEQNPCLGIHGE